MTHYWNAVAAVALVYSSAQGLQAQRTEKFRPQYHFTPNSGWIGDPDGMVLYNSLYHLFWWGHATSPDMVYWDEKPYPIQGDGGPYQVTTGSAVIDTGNVSSLGLDSFINYHTLVNGSSGVGLSMSPDSVNATDNAPAYTDFTLYPSNPTVRPPTSGDFRDPQVFWHALSDRWVMVVAGGSDQKIYFYQSSNLIDWAPAATPSFGVGSVTSDTCDTDLATGSRIWETPDLFELPLDGSTTDTRWVLSIGVKDRMCYLVGSLDGNDQFTTDGTFLRTDAGPDFYSARTWRNYDGPQTRVTMLGWMGNWDYSPVSPSRAAYGGTGAVSVPRDLSLVTFPEEGIRLIQTPIHEIGDKLRASAEGTTNVTVTGTHPITDFVPFQPSSNSYEVDATFTITSPTTPFGLNLLVDHTNNRLLKVTYDPSSSTLSADRTQSYAATGNSTFDSTFPRVASASLSPVNNQIELHMFVDKSSVEIFANNGKLAMTLLTYPEDPQPGIEVFAADGGSTSLSYFTGWQLGSIWSGKPTNAIQSGGVYKVIARHDGKLLDDPQVMNTHPLQQYQDLNGSNQQWRVDLVSAGFYDSNNQWVPPYYQFTNQSNGDAVDLRDGSASNSGVVQQYQQVANDDNQRWQIEEIGGGYFRIISKTSAPNASSLHEAIEVESTPQGEGTADGQPVQTWQVLAYPHQEWQFTLVTPPAN